MQWTRRPTVLVALAALATTLAFMVWYRGSRTPLTDEEQTYYLERVTNLQGPAADFVDLEKTRAFLRADDGQPFYVVNVFKFRDRAQYPLGEDLALSGYEAFRRFSRQILPLWLKRGSHPVFVTTLSTRYTNDWDLVSVVRYRSRRDLIALQTSAEFAQALPHRIAATAANLRLTLPGIQVPALLMLLAAFWGLMFVVAFIVERRRAVRVRASLTSR